MGKIVGIAGAKQSGKTTAMRFLHGYQLRLNDVIKKFFMSKDGEIYVNTIIINEAGEEEDALAILDVELKDPEFMEWADYNVWPFVKTYSFADPLKIIAIQLFGLTEKQCFGTDDDKNTPINIKWERMPDTDTKGRTGFMTAREFLQNFGTDICRKIKPAVWTDCCLKRIQQDDSELAIVPDVRFPNELEAIQEVGGKVIKLTRRPYQDDHSSETSLDSKDVTDKFDYVLDNSKLSIDETNMELLKVLKEWEWLKTKTS
tara:strand:+ start:382 stop:1158 length:777 start_codon:yes stop_codon:yes gene_type:complete